MLMSLTMPGHENFSIPAFDLRYRSEEEGTFFPLAEKLFAAISFVCGVHLNLELELAKI